MLKRKNVVILLQRPTWFPHFCSVSHTCGVAISPKTSQRSSRCLHLLHVARTWGVQDSKQPERKTWKIKQIQSLLENLERRCSGHRRPGFPEAETSTERRRRCLTWACDPAESRVEGLRGALLPLIRGKTCWITTWRLPAWILNDWKLGNWIYVDKKKKKTPHKWSF